MALVDQLIGVTKGTYKAIDKTIIKNGKHNQTFLVIVCECGVAKNIAPSYFDQDKIPKCACKGGKMGGRQYKYWDDKMDEYNIELLEKLDEQFTDYIDETNVYLNLLSEISKHIGNKPSSSTYKYFRAKLDNLNITEDK